jgi:uncharacterized protein (UPF0548 family)
MFLKSRPSEKEISDFIARQAQSHFSYSAVGASADAWVPRGFVADHNRVCLGAGEQMWDNAVRAMTTWQMFRMEWVQLCWPNSLVAAGTDVAILIRHFGFWSLNASRIVYVINEPGGPTKRYGFGYGTLLEHAESGEERSPWSGTFRMIPCGMTCSHFRGPVRRWQNSDILRPDGYSVVSLMILKPR